MYGSLSVNGIKVGESSKTSGVVELGNTFQTLDDNRNLISVGEINNGNIQTLQAKRPFYSPGSIKASVFTLFVAIVGAGMLSLPFALQQSGLILGSLLFILGAMASYFSLRVLIICTAYSGQTTYGTIAYSLLGARASVFLQFILLLYTWGTIIGYLVASSAMIHDAIRISIDRSAGSKYQNDFMKDVSNSTIMIFMTATLVVPLSLFRTLGALRYSSIVAICCAVYLALYVIYSYFDFCSSSVTVSPLFDPKVTQKVECLPELLLNSKELRFSAKSIRGVLTTISIVIFAFTCQTNVLPVYIELQRPTETRMVGKVIFRAILCSLILYLSISVFAYLIFLDQLEDSDGNFLLNDFKNSFGVMLGDVLMSLSIVLAIPIMVNAFRTSVIELGLYAVSSNMTIEKIEGEEAQDVLGTYAHGILTISIIILCLIPALLVSDISSVFALL